ncbi:DedA family protein [Pelagibius litoralis]|uniref:DedA family protein n=1 Tax=Pelagibius litoralis TaxID=374515 RepID=A0A967F148_9PROT|nr:VTT domain-containing protein [Pelagibius litoralis]NIA71150.1 DedA family protein [Pelagibius litoralis]
MESLLDLVREYGLAVYLILLAYCALKSGALPLLAGYAAYTGALDPVLVAAVTFAGGYLGDEARFALARRYGDGLFAGRPRLRRALDTARVLSDHYGTAYMFVYRYPKGMRTIGALPVGLGTLAWSRFTILNAASAALWTALLVGTGYVFGASIAQAVEQGWGLASVVLLVLFVLAVLIAWRQLKRLAVLPNR